jgi:hypothetical protein
VNVIKYICGIALLTSCNNASKEYGAAAARQYCTGCHAFPEPGLLPESQWANHILPSMASFMFADTNGSGTPKGGISHNIWKSIVEYYLKNAPDALAEPAIPHPDTLRGFQVVIPPGRFGIPSLTLLRSAGNGGIILADANNKSWMELRRDFSIAKAGEIAEGGVDVLRWKEHCYSLFMGSFSPNDEALGMLLKQPLCAIERAVVIADSLRRPVCMRAHDWNHDDEPDFVVCEFGRYSGGLSLLLSQPNGRMKRIMLQSSPGAISVELRDFNKDGNMDILVLFAQANERIDLMLSNGNGTFNTRTLMQFPASYGSSSMKLFDMDKDGIEEILYTAGDNADFPAIIKPYHGVYVFRQEKTLDYKQQYFFPLPGAYAVHPGDYNGDGRLEFACISFFPDWIKSPDLGFVIIDPNDASRPKYTYIPRLHQAGRWMLMDTDDVDGDGDTDIILGSMTMETSPVTAFTSMWAKNKIPFVLLRNLTK